MAENNRQAQEFLKLWDQGNAVFQVPTSGSTGIPKIIELPRERMVFSARITGDFLHVQPTDSIFCCLPVNKIGGIMQLVRARVWGLPVSVAEPSGDPMQHYGGNHSVTSLTPMQLATILDHPDSAKKLNSFRVVLIGGGEMHADIEKKVLAMAPEFFHTYGMTETCSHIAMRRLNAETEFRVLPGVEIRLSTDQCLEICSEVTGNQWIQTNDICAIHGDHFQILGRADNVINSGGIKIQPELVEQQIRERWQLPVNSLLIAGMDDVKLGKKAILLIDRSLVPKNIPPGFDFISDKFQRPKAVYFLTHFVYTDTGKIQRQKTLELFLQGKATAN